jgi:3,4-dihydroxy 2-butanone 4-phosphate synthase/GTP cyclohydrolase II
MALIEKEGRGVIIYQKQEGRGIGIINKIRAYALQDGGLDTVEANISLGFKPDLRRYDSCVSIVKQLGLRQIKILTNNPDKVEALRALGIDVVERVALEGEPHEESLSYLRTKKKKFGHMLDRVHL